MTNCHECERGREANDGMIRSRPLCLDRVILESIVETSATSSPLATSQSQQITRTLAEQLDREEGEPRGDCPWLDRTSARFIPDYASGHSRRRRGRLQCRGRLGC